MSEFRAFCRRIHTGTSGKQAEQCDVKFDDPGEFERHMADRHSMYPLKMPKPFQRWRLCRTRKPFEPKPYGVGALVDFAENRGGQVVIRSGQVWSEGPKGEGRSLWVIPKDGGDAVVVKIRDSPSRTGRTYLEVLPRYSMHRLNMRRAENLRRCGQIFPLVDKSEWSYSWTGGKELREHWSWHVDPNCPEAAGKPAPPSTHHAPIGVAEVIRDLLTGRINASTTRYCRACFWLDTVEHGDHTKRA